MGSHSPKGQGHYLKSPWPGAAACAPRAYGPSLGTHSTGLAVSVGPALLSPRTWVREQRAEGPCVGSVGDSTHCPQQARSHSQPPASSPCCSLALGWTAEGRADSWSQEFSRRVCGLFPMVFSIFFLCPAEGTGEGAGLQRAAWVGRGLRLCGPHLLHLRAHLPFRPLSAPRRPRCLEKHDSQPQKAMLGPSRGLGRQGLLAWCSRGPRTAWSWRVPNSPKASAGSPGGPHTLSSRKRAKSAVPAAVS